MTDTTARIPDEQRIRQTPGARHSTPKHKNRLGRGVLGTVPVILASTLALSIGMTAPAEAATPKKPLKAKTGPSVAAKPQSAAPTKAAVITPAAASSAAPHQYRVASGDTVSSIAGRFGLSTASVLASNGLGWKSLIFPGQVLTLGSAPAPSVVAAPAPAPVASHSHTVVSGDTVSGIAKKYGVSQQSMLDANGLRMRSVIYPGQALRVPGKVTPAALAQTPLPAAKPAVSTPSSAGSYTIQGGDTLSSIATKHSRTVQDLLNANGLNWSSIIYAGQTLTIPGSTAVVTIPTSASGAVTLTAEMRGHAQTIVSVGRSAGVSDYGIVIALAAAAQESTLRNLDYGDRDSLGLFQQRPSQGWGSREKILDPVVSTRAFFGGRDNPNRGMTRGLLDIPGWQSMTVTQAAQAVQLSAYPNEYAKWETSAWAWLDELN